MKTLESERAKNQRDIEDLHSRIARGDERDEETRQEVYSLKQKVCLQLCNIK